MQRVKYRPLLLRKAPSSGSAGHSSETSATTELWIILTAISERFKTYYSGCVTKAWIHRNASSCLKVVYNTLERWLWQILAVSESTAKKCPIRVMRIWDSGGIHGWLVEAGNDSGQRDSGVVKVARTMNVYEVM